MKLEISNTPLKVFCEHMLHPFSPSALHCHSYSEIQIVQGGTISVVINKKEYIVGNNEALLIPEKHYHYTDCIKPPDCHFACLIKANFSKVSHIRLPSDFADDFFNSIKKENEENNSPLFANHILFIAGQLMNNITITKHATDYKFIIDNFFAENYHKNTTLSHIAEILKLSPVHAQRVIKAATGKTFGANLLEHRMQIADTLITDGEKTMEEIAAYVGYESYSGFWKAYKKFHRSGDTFYSSGTNKS